MANEYLRQRRAAQIFGPDSPFNNILNSAQEQHAYNQEQQAERQAEAAKVQQQADLQAADDLSMSGMNEEIIPITADDMERAEVIPEGTEPSFDEVVETENEANVVRDQQEAEAAAQLSPEEQVLELLTEQHGSREIAETMLKPSKDGVIPTTSPFELVIPGSYAAAKLAGAAGVKLFMLGLPLESAFLPAVDEISERNIALGMLFGVGTGVGAGAIASKGVTVGERAFKQARFTNMLEEALRDFSMADDQMAPIIARVGTGPTPRTLAKTNLASDKVKVESLYHYDTKTAEVKYNQLKRGVKTGNLQDPRVRKVYKAAAAKIRAEQGPKVSNDEAASLDALDRQIDALDQGQSTQTGAASVDTEFAVKTPGPRTSAATEDPNYGGVDTDGTESISVNAADSESRVASDIPTHVEPIEVVTPEGATVRVSERIKTAVRNEVEAEWWGPKKANYWNDVSREVSMLTQAYKNQGRPFDIKELKASVEAKVTRLYEKGIDADLAERLADVDPASLGGKVRAYIQGGTNQRDARFLVPAGDVGMRPATWTGQSRYQYFDWDPISKRSFNAKLAEFEITDRLQFSQDTNNLVYSADLAPPGPKTDRSGNVPTVLDYAAIDSGELRVYDALAQFYKHWTDPARRTRVSVEGLDFKVSVLPEAQRMKVDTQIYQPGKGFVTIKALPDKEIDAIARIFEWDESVLQPAHSVNREGKLWQTGAEDIIEGHQLHQEWEVTNPGWFDSEARALETSKQAAEAGTPDGFEAHPRYYKMSSGYQQMRSQREAFLREKLGLSKKPPTRENAKYNQQANAAYYKKLDELAVMRNQLMGDIEHTQGTDYEAVTKHAYIQWGDNVAGTKREAMLNEMTDAQITHHAWLDIQRHNKARMEADGDFDTFGQQEAIIRMADEEGITIEDATEQYSRYMDDMSELALDEEDALNRWAREAGDDTAEEISETARLSDEVGTSMQIERNLSFDELADPDTLNIARQVRHIEQQFGMRVRDPHYVPGRGINPIRVNTLDDLTDALKVFDEAGEFLGDAPAFKGQTVGQVLLDDVDPEMMIGVPAYRGHSQDMINRFTYLITDTQQQMAEQAKRVLSGKGNEMAAVGFEKMRAINGVLTSFLAKGEPSQEALAALARVDMTANDSLSFAERIAKVVRANYAIYDNTPDVSQTHMLADMFNDMDSVQQRVSFLHGMSEVDDYTSIMSHTNRLVKSRQKITDKILKECGDA